MDNGPQAFQSGQWCVDAYPAAIGADAVVVLTEWNVFRHVELERISRNMREPVIADFWTLFSPSDVKGSGVTYHCAGRASIVPPERQRTTIVPYIK